MKGLLARFLSLRAHQAGAFCVGAPATTTVGVPARTTISLLTAALFAVPWALTAVILSAAFIPSAVVAQIPGIAGPPPDTVLAEADSTGRAPGLAEADSSAILADSSAILAAMASRIDPTQIHTFSIGFREKSFDESPAARQVAQAFGVQHHERILDSGGLLELLPEILDHLDLVIGCDGAFSVVRAVMQRLDRFNYSQSHLEHGYKELTMPPTSTGDFAMPPGGLHIWPRGGYMMIALPNTDRSFTCTCFWPFTGPNSFDALRTEKDIRDFFTAHFPDAVPLMPTLVEEFMANPTSSLVTIRSRPWHVDGKIVLVGDAAHAVVPFYGQGMNASFEDCVVLDECLDRHPGQLAAALAEYTERRKVNGDAIADLALRNFVEMRDKVGSRLFLLHKKVEKLLHRWLPLCLPGRALRAWCPSL